MKIIRTIAEMRQAVAEWRTSNCTGSVGLVPTMGYLHEGHMSLIRSAKQDNELVVISIFVNPLQFGPNEDYDRYPRDEERDVELAKQAGADYIFKPEPQEMYPTKPLTKVSVDQITSGLCGASRPGHFDGVSTVVTKLFNIIQPDRAYFGLKDAQQVAVIMQMTEDLNMPVEIIPCPIIREADGLALSSRNVYLSAEEREQAVVLSQALQQADDFIKSHAEAQIDELRDVIERTIRSASLAEIDYIEIVDFPSLQTVNNDQKIADVLRDTKVLAALAVKFGSTRLIDNRLWS